MIVEVDEKETFMMLTGGNAVKLFNCLADCRVGRITAILLTTRRPTEYVAKLKIQEAQLPQRNSASAAHVEGGWG